MTFGQEFDSDLLNLVTLPCLIVAMALIAYMHC